MLTLHWRTGLFSSGFMTWVTSRRTLRRLFAVDAKIDAHILFGGAFIVFGVIHSALHVFTYSHFIEAPVDVVADFLGVPKTLRCFPSLQATA